MADKNYLEVRESPFLFGGEELEINGRRYYFKHNYKNPEQAKKFAGKIAKDHQNRGLVRKLKIKTQSW